MAISEKAWSNFSAADYADAAAYLKACLIDQSEPGEPDTKGAGKLPVYEPDGALNRAACHAAAAVLAGARGGVEATGPEKQAAARKLIRLYGQLKEEPPDSLVRLAR